MTRQDVARRYANGRLVGRINEGKKHTYNGFFTRFEASVLAKDLHRDRAFLNGVAMAYQRFLNDEAKKLAASRTCSEEVTGEEAFEVLQNLRFQEFP